MFYANGCFSLVNGTEFSINRDILYEKVHINFAMLSLISLILVFKINSIFSNV